MRGEERHLSVDGDRDEGSPPHVRGRGSREADCPVKHRITPACAGKRVCPTLVEVKPEDHPRMCGEESIHFGDGILCLGSPPHVRGRGDWTKPRTRQAGITPACAGKSSTVSQKPCAAPDHPRVRGEEPVSMERRITRAGSPPRARGRAGCLYRDAGNDGITPACAGKSAEAAPAGDRGEDHPRVRGEEPIIFA